MAAPMSDDDGCGDGIFQQELELLQEIFIHEIEIEKENGYPYELRVTLHPATADRTDLQYVTLTIIFKIEKEYPDVLPDVTIRNPRGLSEEEVFSLQKRLSECAAERSGEAMLYQLIVIAKESLTANNTPSGLCVICYHNFQESDKFTRTGCYHYFHSDCLSRYISYAQQNEEKAICPVCRDELPVEDAPADPISPDEKNAPKFTPDSELKAWQTKMAALKRVQAKRGGIIDVTANSNKFLLNISSTPSVPVNTSTARDSIKGEEFETDSDTADSRDTRKQQEFRSSNHHSERGSHSRTGTTGPRTGRRGARAGGRGRGRGAGPEGRRRHPDSGSSREGRNRSAGGARTVEPSGRRGGHVRIQNKEGMDHNREETEPGRMTPRRQGTGRDSREPQRESRRKAVIEDRGSGKETVVEHGEFNLYGSRDQGTISERKMVDDSAIGTAHEGTERNSSRSSRGSDEGDVMDSEERRIGRNEEKIRRQRQDRDRHRRADTAAGKGMRNGAEHNTGNSDVLVNGRRGTCTRSTTSDQAILVAAVRCAANGKNSEKKTSGINDAAEVKGNIEDELESSSVKYKGNDGEIEGQSQSQAGLKKEQGCPPQDRRWRGRGRRNFNGPVGNDHSSKEDSTQHGGKEKKGQMPPRENYRGGGRGVTHFQGGNRGGPASKEHRGRGERPPMNRKEQYNSKPAGKRVSSGTSGNSDLQTSKSDKVVPMEKRVPPGFSSKPRPPPGFGEFR